MTKRSKSRLSEQVSEQQSPTEDQPRDVFAEVMETQARMAAGAARFNARWMEQTAGFTFEIFDFINQRLGQDLAATQALGKCKTVESAFETLGEFQKKALEDYTCESAKLTAKTTHSSDVLREEAAEDAELVSKAVVVGLRAA